MYSQQQYQPQQQQYTPQYQQQQYSPQYQPQQQQYSPQYQQQGMMAPMQSQTTMITQQQPGMMMAPGMVVARESCRSNTRCIAYVDIVLSILQLINAIVVIIAAFGVIALLNDHAIPVPIIFYAVTAVGIILLPLCIADLVIACGLLKSTDPITPPQIAAEKASCWRCYNIFFLIFSVIGGGVCAGAGIHAGDGNFLWFVLRIVCVCIVHKYIQELEFTVVPVMGMGMGQTTTMMTTTAPGANQFGGQQQYQPQGSPSSQQQQPKPEQQGQQ